MLVWNVAEILSLAEKMFVAVEFSVPGPVAVAFRLVALEYG